MIKIIDDNIDDFLKFLDRCYPTNSDVYIHLLEDSKCIEIPYTENEYSYGIVRFPKNNNTNIDIYISMDIEEDKDVLHVIAHEYAHLMQWDNKKDLDEDEANNIADDIVNRFRCEIRTTIEDCFECKFCNEEDNYAK